MRRLTPENWDETLWDPFYFGPYESWFRIDHFRLPVVLGLLVFSLVSLRRQKPVGHIVCVYLFTAYVWVFLAQTIFPFPIEFRVNEFPRRAFHWTPFFVGGSGSVFTIFDEQVWGNFLAGVPFGFGLPFLTLKKDVRLRHVAALGLAWSILPEFVQLLQIWLFARYMPRVIDINDVLLCFVGTLSGYGMLYLFSRFYRRVASARGATLPGWKHFHEVFFRIGNDCSHTQTKF